MTDACLPRSKEAMIAVPFLVRDRFERRFWPKVDRAGSDFCWEWQGALNNKGYGVINIGTGKVAYAHRISLELHGIEIPDDMCAMHDCDNPKCVRHVRVGTRKENTQDMLQKGRHSHGARHGKAVSDGRRRAHK